MADAEARVRYSEAQMMEAIRVTIAGFLMIFLIASFVFGFKRLFNKKERTMTTNTWVANWSVQSKTEPEKLYVVSRAVGGHYGCSCPAWKFAKAPKPDCKHINDVRNNYDEFGNELSGRTNLDTPTTHYERASVLRNFPDGSSVQMISSPRRSVRVHRSATVQTQAFIITELSQAELLAGPLRRKVRRGEE